MCDFCKDLFSGVLASIIAVLVFELYKFFLKKLENYKLKKLFGNDDILYFIVPELEVDVNNLKPNITHPLKHKGLQKSISSHSLLGMADVLALKYIQELLFNKLKNKMYLSTDIEQKGKLDISLVSFGSSSIYCNQIISYINKEYNIDDKNIYYNNQQIWTIDNVYDYGLIIKFNSGDVRNRTWVIIAGLGETGTKGAAWYLSYNWKKIVKKFGENSFAIVVKVKHGYEQKVEVVSENQIAKKDGDN